MNISKNKVFNKFFKDCTYIVYLFILTLIPWIEFLNENIAEVDFILNKNFYFVLIMYLFTISFVYFLIRILTNFSRSHIICIAGLSVWILFQHNFIKSELGLILKKINFELFFETNEYWEKYNVFSGGRIEKFKNEKIEKVFNKDDGFNFNNVRAITQDISNRLLVVGNAGLSVYENNTFKTFSAKDGI